MLLDTILTALEALVGRRRSHFQKEQCLWLVTPVRDSVLFARHRLPRWSGPGCACVGGQRLTAPARQRVWRRHRHRAVLIPPGPSVSLLPAPGASSFSLALIPLSEVVGLRLRTRSFEILLARRPKQSLTSCKIIKTSCGVSRPLRRTSETSKN